MLPMNTSRRGGGGTIFRGKNFWESLDFSGVAYHKKKIQMLYVSVHVLYSSYFMNNGGGDAVAPGRGFVVAVQNQNIVPRLGVFLYMGGFADGCKRG